MNRIIEIVVSPTGESRIETKGYVGNECRQATERIERALGARSNEQLKTEFYQSESSWQRTAAGR